MVSRCPLIGLFCPVADTDCNSNGSTGGGMLLRDHHLLYSVLLALGSFWSGGVRFMATKKGERVSNQAVSASASSANRMSGNVQAVSVAFARARAAM